jgi:L-seryl-tRNA(Ser) seleniumtransferase
MPASVYESLGVTPLINCATTYTRIGGSIMDPEVAQAMADSANAFVDVVELQAAVGKRLAELTNNESAYVSNGVAAGLALATAAAMTGEDLALMARLPGNLDGMKNEVVVHRVQRNWYDIAIRQVGAKIIEIGHTMETAPWELDDAINDRTAAVVYFAGDHLNHRTLPLPYVVERAHARGIPVIVDAAAQLPPKENLWKFTREDGADLALFSGGKGMFGPQNSGLAVGSESLIRAMRLNGPPNQRIGRSLKVSKEAMIGLLAAVQKFVETDFEAKAVDWNKVVDQWLDDWEEVRPESYILEKDNMNEAGEPIPRVILHTNGGLATRNALIDELRTGSPPIEVVLYNDEAVAFSPHLLQPGEAETVSGRVTDILRQTHFQSADPA